ncbi:MAG: sigma-70 family RNA polymerase sigma factor [Gammaproteobacteria bacterium]|nr:sigma-70 family RNA polymerase sigma factor [Gammaproteobacteria bacterium]
MRDGSEAQPESQISADLVARIGRGERAAEQQMVRRYERGLLYLLNRRCGDPELAADVRQETFRIAIEKLREAPLEEPERLSAYLRGVALNLLLAHRRKESRRATTTDSDAVDAAADERGGPFDHVSDAELRTAVRALLAELRTPRDREILTRVYLHDEDKESVCRGLGVDGAHFHRVLFRAKQRFRELLLQADRKGRVRLVPESAADGRAG